MKIFLDFDNTLLDTRGLVNTLCKPYLQSVGYSMESIEEGFRGFASGADLSKPTFTVEKYLDALGMEKEQQSICAPKLLSFFERAQEFLFPGVEDFLRSLASHQVTLLTFGDHQFQNLKITSSGIQELIPAICITEGNKSEEIQSRVTEGESFIFVDDHGEYFEPLKEKFGSHIFVLHFLPPHMNNTCPGCSADGHATNTQEITRFIQTVCAA